MNPRVFVSHASPDTQFATRFSADLRELGADVWLDSSHMGSGDFVARISRALERDVLILILSPDAVKSPWVQQEVNAAITRSNQGLMRPPIVISAGPTPVGAIPALWTIYHRYDAMSNYQEALRGVAAELGLIAPPVTQPSSVGQPQPSVQSDQGPFRRPIFGKDTQPRLLAAWLITLLLALVVWVLDLDGRGSSLEAYFALSPYLLALVLWIASFIAGSARRQFGWLLILFSALPLGGVATYALYQQAPSFQHKAYMAMVFVGCVLGLLYCSTRWPQPSGRRRLK